MDKLNFFGVGPKIAVIGLPYLILTIAASIIYREPFRYTSQTNKPLFIAGIIVLLVGLIFYGLTARLLMKGLRQTALITSGTYFCCQNPLYAAFILMIIPGLSLLLNSWLVLTASLVMYLAFKLFIKSEYRELEMFFGEKYKSYRMETPEIWPFPIRKILH